MRHGQGTARAQGWVLWREWVWSGEWRCWGAPVREKTPVGFGEGPELRFTEHAGLTAHLSGRMGRCVDDSPGDGSV